jgi:hypothetical protein
MNPLPEPGEMKSQDMQKGVQPLDQVMKDLGLEDVHLVDISKKQLTFRNVAKARKGRQIKFRVQEKILSCLNACSPDKKFRHEDIFNYKGPA